MPPARSATPDVAIVRSVKTDLGFPPEQSERSDATCYDDAFDKVTTPKDAAIVHHDRSRGSVFTGSLVAPNSPPDRSEARSAAASWPATTNRPARSRATVAAAPLDGQSPNLDARPRAGSPDRSRRVGDRLGHTVATRRAPAAPGHPDRRALPIPRRWPPPSAAPLPRAERSHARATTGESVPRRHLPRGSPAFARESPPAAARLGGEGEESRRLGFFLPRAARETTRGRTPGRRSSRLFA